MKAYQQMQELPENGMLAIQEGSKLRLFFDFKKAVLPDMEGETKADDIYECESVDVDGGRSYDDIVSAIIGSRYKSDKVQAVIANYVDATNAESTTEEDKKEEYKAEYAAYQEWRNHAKETAKAVLELIGG
jgi:hypothetical protein